MSIADKLTKLATDINSAYAAIDTKGGTVPEHKNTENLADAIGSIEGGGGGAVVEKDVNFYDYDGTLTKSYTKAEFLALTAMPDNPDRTSEGLTADGWNWSFSGAQSYVTNYGKLNVGQTYHPTDDKTHIFIELDNFTNICLGCPINGTVVVDWGDGNTETITASEGTSAAEHWHEYDETGEYEITLAGDANNTYGLRGGSSGSTVIWGGDSISSNNQRPYQSTIRKVLVANTGVVFGSYCFNYCMGLRYISVPSNFTTFKSRMFNYCRNLSCLNFPTTITGENDEVFHFCYGLKYINCSEFYTGYISSYGTDVESITIPSGTQYGGVNLSNSFSLRTVVIPDGMTSLSSSMFLNSFTLEHVELPDSITTISSSAFSSTNLRKIIMPASLSSIKSSAFSGCYNLTLYDLSKVTVVPSLESTNALTLYPETGKILVPQELLADFQTATNWSSFASYMVGV